jgi:uncharacterized membrane protein
MVHAIQNEKEIGMKNILSKLVWPIALIPGLYLAIAWNSIPETVAMHFDLNGNPDRWGSKRELLGTTAILFVMSLFVYFLLTNIYKIDPKKYAAENKDRLRRIAFAVVIFVTGISTVIIYHAQSGSLKMSMGLILAGVGLLFSFIGNYMPNLKPNYFMGLRLPWTLENEDNWRKTHSLAGKLWFAGGLSLAVICLFLPNKIGLIVFFVVMIVITVIPIVYSYKLYKEGRRER